MRLLKNNKMQKPSEPKKYKWVVLGGLFLIYMASNGITMHTLPLLYPELVDHFGWSAAQVTLPATIFFIIGAITSPPAGWLLDRFSPRRIILVGSVILFCALIIYGKVTALWELVLVYAVLGVGLSMSGLVSNMVVLSGWFDESRGRATGILLMASSLGGAVFPLLVGKSLLLVGWRDTAMIMAGATGLLMVLSTILLLRDPKKLSLTDTASTGAKAINVDMGPSLISALRDSKFYRIALATGALWFVIIALVQHQSLYLARDLGLARESLPTVFSVFFGCSIIGKLLFGLLSDYFDLRRIMAFSILLLGVAVALLQQLQISSNFMVYGYAVLGGIGFSGAFTCIQLLIASFYRGAAYGRILAILVLMDTLCGALGTRLVGLVREAQGSYAEAFSGMVLLCIIAAAIVTTLPIATGSEEAT